jgi:hypothetical protein
VAGHRWSLLSSSSSANTAALLILYYCFAGDGGGGGRRSLLSSSTSSVNASSACAVCIILCGPALAKRASKISCSRRVPSSLKTEGARWSASSELLAASANRSASSTCIRQHTSACVSTCQHMLCCRMSSSELLATSATCSVSHAGTCFTTWSSCALCSPLTANIDISASQSSSMSLRSEGDDAGIRRPE